MHPDCSAAGNAVRVRRLLFAALAALALTLTLAACGTQFAYNRLGWLSHYYLANQVSLDGSQSSALRANLRDFFAWHRRAELPRYADFLERLAEAVSQPMTVAQYDAGRVEIEGFVRDSVAHGAPDAARWLQGLRPEQLDELFASYADDEREKRAEHCDADPQERRQASAERFIDKVEDWTGRLRRSQRELIAARLAAFEGDACQDVSTQERSRLAFRTLVDEHRTDPDFAARIAVFMARPQDRWDDDYRRRYLANRSRFMQLLAELDQTLSATQRARAVDQLRDFATGLRALAAQPPDP